MCHSLLWISCGSCGKRLFQGVRIGNAGDLSGLQLEVAKIGVGVGKLRNRRGDIMNLGPIGG